MRRRLSMLLVMVASGAAALSWFAPSDGQRMRSSAAGAAGAERPVATPRAGPAVLGAGLPARAAFRDAGADPFASSAAPPPSAAAARPAAPAPSAPALPYRFVGRVYQDSGTKIFLTRGAKVLEARKGEILDGEYRVDSASGAELTLTHLPSGRRQVMQFTPPIEEDGRIARALTLEHGARAAPRSIE